MLGRADAPPPHKPHTEYNMGTSGCSQLCCMAVRRRQAWRGPLTVSAARSRSASMRPSNCTVSGFNAEMVACSGSEAPGPEGRT